MTLHSAEQSEQDAIVRVGSVISVKGRTIEVRVDKSKNASHLVYLGELVRNISVGGYVKIVKGFTRIIGKVEGEEVKEDRTFHEKQSYASGREKIDRILTVSLLGFFKGNRFERGIKELPLLDNECYLLQKNEFEQVHNFIRSSDEPLTIGRLSYEKGQEIRLGVNGLFASHIGIFGNTGSGKSYTLAKLYRELFVRFLDKHKFRHRAKFLLIDFNGEYATGDGKNADIIVEKQYKNTYVLSTRTTKGKDKLPITREDLDDPDLWVVFLEATEKTQMPFLRRAVANKYIAPRIKDVDELKQLIARTIAEATASTDRNTERTAVVNFLKELRDALGDNESIGELLDDYDEHLKYHTTNNVFYYQPAGGGQIYADKPQFKQQVIENKVAQLAINVETISAIDEIRLQIIFQYYTDIIRGFSNKEHLAPLIKRLDKRIDDLKKIVVVGEANVFAGDRNIAIVSLRDVSLHMRKVLPLLVCKRLYNNKKAANNDKEYLSIIIDEAHNILSQKSERESEQWKDYRLETFEEVIKEGRKFGVFLTVASQRPSDISPTIISQLHHYFLHRLINNEDLNAIRQTISYLDKVSFESIPLLPTGTCIFAGLLANVPIVLDIGEIVPKVHEPKNKTITLVDKWV